MMDRISNIKTRLGKALADYERRSLTFAVLVAAGRAFNRHHSTHLAAGIAYYAIFSLFPLLLGLIAIANSFLQTADAQARIVAVASQWLPASAPLVSSTIGEVLRIRGTIGILAAILLLWSAKSVFGAMTTSLNLAWEAPEKRSFWEITAIQMVLVIGVGVFIALSLALTSLLAIASSASTSIIGQALDLAPFWTTIAELVSLALIVLAFILIFRYLPSASSSFSWQDVWRGALVSGVLFEIAKLGYVVFITRFTRYGLIYGSLGAVIILLFWAWLCGLILLFGAEISAQYVKLKDARS